jgi:hypothetical protein
MSRLQPVMIFLVCLFIIFAPAQVSAGQRFVDNGDGTVTDNKLNLMWSSSDNQGDINWRQSQQWVKFTFPYTLDVSYDNWRLPTLAELQSLYVEESGNESDCGQVVHVDSAIKLSCGWIWSSETSAIQAWVFNFQRGIYYSDRMVHKRAYRALPVRNLKE